MARSHDFNYTLSYGVVYLIYAISPFPGLELLQLCWAHRHPMTEAGSEEPYEKKCQIVSVGIPRSEVCRHLLVRLVMITYLFIVGINVEIGPKDPGNYTKIPRLMT